MAPSYVAAHQPTQARERTMKTKNLATALAAALSRTPAITPPKPEVSVDLLLVAALRNSATRRDQIIQRRIGVYPDTVGAMS